MPDPNRSRDQALAEISRSLKSIDTSLKDIAKSVRVRSGRVGFTNYLKGDEQDGATAPAGSADPGPHSESQTGPYGIGTTHPYT